MAHCILTMSSGEGEPAGAGRRSTRASACNVRLIAAILTSSRDQPNMILRDLMEVARDHYLLVLQGTAARFLLLFFVNVF